MTAATKIDPRRKNVETEQPKVEDQPNGDEQKNDDEPETKPGEQAQAFDPNGYIPEPLQLPKVDGEGIDKIGCKFAGLVRLDRSDAADCTLVRDSKLGSTVTLMVECEVGPPVPGYTTNKDGDLDALALTRQFKVISVYKAAIA